MEARNLPPPGETFLIPELCSLQVLSSVFDGKSINVTGRLDFHDVNLCRAKIVDPKTGLHIFIDTSFVEPFTARMGSLFQFVGEMQTESTRAPDRLILKARLVRCVDGLDLQQFEKALKIQREYLESTNTGQ